MAKTYLQCVNLVLKRLREAQVGGVSDSAYSALIGEFVNDAKRVVEDSWTWGCLRNPVSLALVASTRTYNLTDSGTTTVTAPYVRPNERSLLLLARDVTSTDPITLSKMKIDALQEQYELNANPPSNSSPNVFGTYTYGDNFYIELSEIPTAVRNWKFIFKRPQDDLDDDADILLVPYHPVILLATNYALNERGEEVGQPGAEAEKKYLNSLADATALDSAQYDREFVFTND